MPSLNFKKEFVPAVELGLREPENPKGKRQSIRAYRKDGRDPRPGQTLYLYYGLRTKQVRKLGEAECRKVADIGIGTSGAVFLGDDEKGSRIVEGEELEAFARADGFESATCFVSFFRETHGLPFFGQVNYW